MEFHQIPGGRDGKPVARYAPQTNLKIWKKPIRSCFEFSSRPSAPWRSRAIARH
jgi:hypothetical protein